MVSRYFLRSTCYTSKFVDPGDILIVCLYVDDLISTGNNLRIIAKFKEAMISYFEMTNLGLMSYFLGIEVIQQDDGIYISQKKYVDNILKKFKTNFHISSREVDANKGK